MRTSGVVRGNGAAATGLLTRLGSAATTVLLVLGLTVPGAAAPPSAWTSRGVGGGGALFSPSFSPHAPDELYVGCDMSELFHTTDLGRSWESIDFRQIQGNHESRVQFTEDPQVLYTIDYSIVALFDLMRPVKSLDGGRTWTPLPGDPTGGDVWALRVDPADQRRVLLTDYNTLHFSSDGGASFAPRFTDSTGAGCHIAGVLFDGASIYVGTNAGLLVSTDGGASFALSPATGIPANEAMVGFAGAKQGATLRFVAVTHNRADVYNGIQGWDHYGYVSVYTLDLGQPSWTRRTLPANAHGFYAGMALGNVSVMWVAGAEDALGQSFYYPGVWKSTDGGASWQASFRSVGNANCATGWSGDGGDRGWGYGECALGFAVSPVDPNRVAYTDYGFTHVTSDGGASWKQAYVDPAGENPAGSQTPRREYYRGVGLENTTSWCLTWADPQTLFACFSDIQGIRSADAGATWGYDYSGHTLNSMYRVVRHSNGTLYGATASVHDMYQSTRLQDAQLDGGQGEVRFSTDAGRTWQLLHAFGHNVVWVALDPTNPSRLYASVIHSTQGGVFVSGDIQNGSSSTWTRLALPPRTEGHPFNIVVLSDGALVATYSGRRTGSGFTASSGVFLSTDGGASWSDRSDAGMRYWTKDLVVDPSDPTESTWYAGVFSGWGGPPNGLGGLYRTRDRGQSWVRINANDRVTSLTISPVAPDEAYMTTETSGLFHTSNLSAATPTFTGTVYPFRQPERVFFNPYDPTEIWVTSFGRGLMVGSTAPPTGQSLLRNTMVTEVAPIVNPALATFLPVAAPRDAYRAGVLPGDLDADPDIVTDGNLPLAFYALEGAAVLKLAKTPALRLAVWY